MDEMDNLNLKGQNQPTFFEDIATLHLLQLRIRPAKPIPLLSAIGSSPLQPAPFKELVSNWVIENQKLDPHVYWGNWGRGTTGIFGIWVKSPLGLAEQSKASVISAPLRYALAFGRVEVAYFQALERTDESVLFHHPFFPRLASLGQLGTQPQKPPFHPFSNSFKSVTTRMFVGAISSWQLAIGQNKPISLEPDGARLSLSSATHESVTNGASATQARLPELAGTGEGRLYWESPHSAHSGGKIAAVQQQIPPSSE